MAGNKTGGQKAAKTNKEKYGDNFYAMIGSRGGQVVTIKPKGFAANPKLAREAGRKGGLKSRRNGITTGQGKEKEYIWKGGTNEKLIFKKI